MNSEFIEQVTFVNWFKENYPQYIIFAIPNGGLRHRAVADKLKLEGVLAGVPDLCILLEDGKSIYIEMKREKNSHTSKEQKELHKKMITLGHTVYVCKGYLEAIKVISDLSIV